MDRHTPRPIVTVFTPDNLGLTTCHRCWQLWNGQSSKRYVDHVYEHCPDPIPKKQYAFTFTTNDDDRPKAQRELCYAVQKLFLQRTNPIAQGGAWLEYTEAGRPHIHGWYETEDGGRVFAKTFARCWHLWKEKRGMTRFPGGYHEQLKSNRYIGYASAEGREVVSKKENEEMKFNFDAEKMEPQSLIE